jgi:hypothetical protein
LIAQERDNLFLKEADEFLAYQELDMKTQQVEDAKADLEDVKENF